MITFFSNYGAQIYSTDSTQPDDTSRVKMKASSSGMASIELRIDGTNLSVSYENNAAWLLDLDFDAQHKKFFEQASAVYLIQLPNIIANSSTPKYAIAQVTNNLDASATLTVNLAISDSNYQPIAADTELTDIDVNDWFNNLTGSTNFNRIADLIKKILQVEYFLPERVTINIGNEYQETWTVDGGVWNLFTDGSKYTPLVMISRFPNGAPIRREDIEEEVEIEVARFDRAPAIYELVGLIQAVIQNGNDVAETVSLGYDVNNGLSFFGTSITLQAKITGNTLKITDGADLANVYDVDLDNQHQRPLNLPSSETPVMFECANPDILGVGGDKLDLFMFNNLGDPKILVVTNADGTEVMGSSGQLPPRSYQDTPSTVLSLINNILEMEFSNYDDFTTDTEMYTDEPISGTVDLLAVSTVTPA